MRLKLACACLLLAACGPVLLVGDAPPAGSSAEPRTQQDAATTVVVGLPDAGPAAAAAGGNAAAPQGRGGSMPRALLSVMPVDCGRCFDLMADATGGTPPYQYQWDDGTRNQSRRVCVEAQRRDVSVSVIVQDAEAVRSPPSITVLAAEDADAACPPEAPTRRLCLMNPSFEGTPAINVGQNFDAMPWSTCNNDSSTSNTPDIGSDVSVIFGNAPKVQDGASYVALGQGEQVSQPLCEDVPGGAMLNLQLDVMRVDIAPGDPTKVFLELWGGIAADCSQRQLLWASPALGSTWTRYCVRLKPVDYMNQLTLRSNTDVTTLAPEYLVVDHLVPVDQCP